MNNNQSYIVQKSLKVLEALKIINEMLSLHTLIVIDENKKVVGTITDGDIRRGFINGLQLNDSIEKFMHRDFHFLIDGEDNFLKLKVFRKKRIKAVPLLDKEGRLIKIYNFTEIKSILPIDAVVMAGGKGMRLRPLTKTVPKPLLKVGKKEIISYNFDRLFQYGITQQHITVNYLGKQIENYCKQYPNQNIDFDIVYEPEMLGTAGALRLIKHFENDTILLMNSDLLTNIDYEDFYKTFIEKNADMLVASIPYEVNLPYAIFESEGRQVKSLKEKPNYTYYANAGIYLFKKDLLDLVPENGAYNATDFMEDVMTKGFNLLHYPIREYWLDIGKHVDFEKAQKDIAHINWD